jgi:hypothetical protein
MFISVQTLGLLVTCSVRRRRTCARVMPIRFGNRRQRLESSSVGQQGARREHFRLG